MLHIWSHGAACTVSITEWLWLVRPFTRKAHCRLQWIALKAQSG